MAGDVPSALKGFIIDNIQLGKQIGRGANGRILEAKWEGATIAVKEIHSVFINEVSKLEFQALKTFFQCECEQNSRLRHPNIVVRFFGIYWPPAARMPSLVMERLHCSLTGLLEQNPILQIETKLSILRDVALGLRYGTYYSAERNGMEHLILQNTYFAERIEMGPKQLPSLVVII